MAEVLLFHHAQGQTPGFLAFADELRRGRAHRAHARPLRRPHVREPRRGHGVRRGRSASATLIERGVAGRGRASRASSSYAGFSLGVMPAQKLAQTRPGARGALLFDSCRPDLGVRVGMAGGRAGADPRHGRRPVLRRARATSTPPARSSSRPSTAELFLYPGDQHLFADCQPAVLRRRRRRAAQPAGARLPRHPLTGHWCRSSCAGSPATRRAGSPSGRSCSTPTARRPADGGRPADVPAARPHGRGGAQRRPRRLEPAGKRVRACPPAAGARAGPHVVRAPAPGRGRAVVAWCARWRTSVSTSPTWPPGRSGTRSAVGWLAANDGFRRRVLDQLGASGPLPSRDIPDSAEVPWPSTGWTNDRNVTQMLEFLASRGEVAVAGRRGRQRLWDLAERVYPADMPVVPADEAREIRDERRLRSLGVARPQIVGDCRHPGRGRGHGGRVAGRPRGDRRGLRGTHRTAVAVRPADPRPGPRQRSCSTSSTTSRCTSPRPSGAGDTSRCPCSTTTSSSARSTPPPTARRSSYRCMPCTRTSRFTRAMTAAVHAELAALAQWLGLDGVRFA